MRKLRREGAPYLHKMSSFRTVGHRLQSNLNEPKWLDFTQFKFNSYFAGILPDAHEGYSRRATVGTVLPRYDAAIHFSYQLVHPIDLLNRSPFLTGLYDSKGFNERRYAPVLLNPRGLSSRPWPQSGKSGILFLSRNGAVPRICWIVSVESEPEANTRGPMPRRQT
ncbi:hypothetical protein K469DRAFT_689834 [Zopfia rhizophila CBS 207.26]|uniref:Uncharacterized protein n=1 Tax=Zopfia rhizophila CBS 207.26 TaxID=1314779 RepID=A0A6A6DZI3_9PEZI|nr:hypothetical protein K469DRAFT_689834 [Zopfia rhizophila CBS 207.26]